MEFQSTYLEGRTFSHATFVLCAARVMQTSQTTFTIKHCLGRWVQSPDDVCVVNLLYAAVFISLDLFCCHCLESSHNIL